MVSGLLIIATIIILVGWLLQLILGKGKLNVVFAILFFVGAILMFIGYAGDVLMLILWIIIAILAILSAFVGKKK